MEDNNKLKIENRKLSNELLYYKGFYEGVKEMTTLFGDGPIDINHNVNVKGLEENEKDTKPEKAIIKKIEGKNAERFINIMKELGVE